MDLPSVFTRYRPAITQGLREALTESDLPLYGMQRYHLGWQDEHGKPLEANSGKAVRPALCLFACEAVSGQWRTALPAAIAVELIHNFSLVHDDIQDGDTHRRHRATVWYLWGHSHGVNAGDAMNILGNLAMFGGDGAALPPQTALTASRILTKACADMIEGQVLDLSFEQRAAVRVDDYLVMISKKTGALLAASLHMGAAIGTREERTTAAMLEFGKGLGLLFQVRDDMLGVWGKSEVTGKSASNDIHRRKKSLPVVHALEHAKGPSRDRLQTIYKSDTQLTDADLADVLTIFTEVGSARYCEELAQQTASASLRHIETIEIAPQAKRECAEMTRFLLEREY